MQSGMNEFAKDFAFSSSFDWSEGPDSTVAPIRLGFEANVGQSGVVGVDVTTAGVSTSRVRLRGCGDMGTLGRSFRYLTRGGCNRCLGMGLTSFSFGFGAFLAFFHSSDVHQGSKCMRQ